MDKPKPFSELRVLSYNIHGCVGRNGSMNPEAILEVLHQADADIIALQEVHDYNKLQQNFLNQLEATRKWSVHYGPTMQLPTGRYGNVLLSRLPVRSVTKIDLSIQDREPRGAIYAQVRSGQKTIEVVATHLGLKPQERRLQIQRIADHLPHWRSESSADLRLGLGDFNEWFLLGKGHKHLQDLLGKAPRRRTFPSQFPIFPLDRIFVRPRNMLKQLAPIKTPVSVMASDHLPLLAIIRVEGPPKNETPESHTAQ